jgi:hypothetical protein
MTKHERIDRDPRAALIDYILRAPESKEPTDVYAKLEAYVQARMLDEGVPECPCCKKVTCLDCGCP